MNTEAKAVTNRRDSEKHDRFRISISSKNRKAPHGRIFLLHVFAGVLIHPVFFLRTFVAEDFSVNY